MRMMLIHENGAHSPTRQQKKEIDIQLDSPALRAARMKRNTKGNWN